MEEFDFSELEWNRDGLVSSAYAEQIENYKPAWQVLKTVWLVLTTLERVDRSLQ